MSLASPVGDVVIDAPELRSSETSLGGTTGDPVELDGVLALGEGSFCAENLAARDARNEPTLTPHPDNRSFA
jgi:hypothetical protein